MIHQIHQHLSPDFPWKDRILFFPSIGSTNDVLKEMARQGAPHGTAVLAGQQTGGHGRMGRSFHSPEGMGIYLSILLRPDCPASDLMHLTCAAAVAMCDAVEKTCGLRPGIKWTNDLVHGKNKLGGILTELGLTGSGALDYAIIGIGINCRQQASDFPEDIRSIAASLNMVTGQDVSPAALAAAMLESLQKMDASLLTEKTHHLSRYRADCITIGQEISILQGDTIRHGRALSVDSEGALVVAFSDGTTEAVNSGEVRIRGMYGYI